MELYIERASLLKALEKIDGIIDVKRVLPILTNTYFKAHENRITLYATDLNLSVITETPAEVTVPGETVIPAKPFYQLIKELEDGKLHLLYDGKSNRMNIRIGKYSGHIACLSPEDFPNIPNYQFPQTVEFHTSLLIDIYKKIKFSISDVKQKFGLSGILFHFKEKSVSCVTTDRHRLSFGEFYLPKYSPDFQYKQVVLSRKCLDEFNKMFSAEDNIIAYASDKNLTFAQENNILITKFLDEEFPDYSVLIPKEFHKVYQVDRKELILALKRVVVLSNEITRGIIMDFKGKTLTVRSTESELGKAEATLDVAPDLGSYSICFNARYILDVLDVLTEDTVEFCFKEDNEEAAVLRDKERYPFIYVVMPIS